MAPGRTARRAPARARATPSGHPSPPRSDAPSACSRTSCPRRPSGYGVCSATGTSARDAERPPRVGRPPVRLPGRRGRLLHALHGLRVHRAHQLEVVVVRVGEGPDEHAAVLTWTWVVRLL